ncbi:MAG: fumarylacetoacetate hydrolase family protein [Firmicutes bacterium]|nr:fumarylacetoacetate hydrolase family protein [Bacillota bacterium]
MKLVTFKPGEEESWQVGLILASRVIPLGDKLEELGLPFKVNNMSDFLKMGDRAFHLAQQVAQKAGSTEEGFALNSVKLGPPVIEPGKIICVGLNYTDHALEGGNPIPEEPVLFGKYANAIVGPGGAICLPPESKQVDFEAELAVVIGEKTYRVSEKEALSCVAGYLNFNDISARDLQRRDGQWMKGKFLDTFAPIGPWLVTPDEVGNPNKLDIKLFLNGEIMQSSNTENMIFSVEYLISFISSLVTLLPGDIIATGTPSGVGYARKPPVFLKEGDIVQVAIEKLGVLENLVVRRKA